MVSPVIARWSSTIAGLADLMAELGGRAPPDQTCRPDEQRRRRCGEAAWGLFRPAGPLAVFRGPSSGSTGTDVSVVSAVGAGGLRGRLLADRFFGNGGLFAEQVLAEEGPYSLGHFARAEPVPALLDRN